MPDLATLAGAYAAAGLPTELTVRQIALLGVICDEAGPHHVRYLAERVSVSKPVVTRAINAFVTGGLVHRSKSADDRRDVLITPTKQGRALREQIGQLGGIA